MGNYFIKTVLEALEFVKIKSTQIPSEGLTTVNWATNLLSLSSCTFDINQFYWD